MYVCNNNKAQCIQLLLLTFTLTVINCTKCQKLIYTQSVPGIFCEGDLIMSFTAKYVFEIINSSEWDVVTDIVCGYNGDEEVDVL